MSSLENNFTASEKGCINPPTLTLLGPLRLWISPRILRSISVKKATFTNTGIRIKIKFILSIITMCRKKYSPLLLQSNALFKLFLHIITLHTFLPASFIIFAVLSASLLLGVFLVIQTQGCVFLVAWIIPSFGASDLECPILVDNYRTVFASSVLIIASSVIFFSQYYIQGDSHFVRFHILVILFVFSILLLIFSPHLITLLMGWDGLGVTSFLLVVYFQSTKSSNAGILTVLTNRLGDLIILLAICLRRYLGT